MNDNQIVSTAQTPQNKVVSVITFTGLFILFSIPLIGWIICLITALVSSNKNVSHFALGFFVAKLIIFIIVCIALAIITPIIISGIQTAISGFFCTDLGNIINDLISGKGFSDLLLNLIGDIDISSLISSLSNGSLDMDSLSSLMKSLGGESIDMEALLDDYKKSTIVDISNVDLSKYGITEEDIGDLDLSAVSLADIENILPEGSDLNAFLEEAGLSDEVKASLMDYFNGLLGGSCIICIGA